MLRREGGESLRYLDGKPTLEMGQNERKEVAGSIGLIRAQIEFLGLHFVYSCDIMIGGGVVSITKGGDGGGSVHYGSDKVFSWSARMKGGDGGGRVAARW
ncbi:hypothetical protein Tco_0264959 [Tanacetum coccineum]